jgi:hypothetical protein
MSARRHNDSSPARGQCSGRNQRTETARRFAAPTGSSTCAFEATNKLRPVRTGRRPRRGHWGSWFNSPMALKRLGVDQKIMAMPMLTATPPGEGCERRRHTISGKCSDPTVFDHRPPERRPPRRPRRIDPKGWRRHCGRGQKTGNCNRWPKIPGGPGDSKFGVACP